MQSVIRIEIFPFITASSWPYLLAYFGRKEMIILCRNRGSSKGIFFVGFWDFVIFLNLQRSGERILYLTETVTPFFLFHFKCRSENHCKSAYTIWSLWSLRATGAEEFETVTDLTKKCAYRFAKPVKVRLTFLKIFRVAKSVVVKVSIALKMADQGRFDFCAAFTMSLHANESKQTLVSLLFEIIQVRNQLCRFWEAIQSYHLSMNFISYQIKVLVLHIFLLFSGPKFPKSFRGRPLPNSLEKARLKKPKDAKEYAQCLCFNIFNLGEIL